MPATVPSDSPTAHDPRRATLLACLGLALLVFLAFWPALGAHFVLYDDDIHVAENPRVLTGLTPENIAWAFSTAHGGYPMPLTWLSFQLDATLAGTPLGPPNALTLDATVYHATNILLQAAGAVVLFLALRRATGRFWASWLVAALWAVHPLRVESVAWVTERKDVLGGVLAFATLYAYITWRQTERPKMWWVCVGLYLACLLAKPLFLTVPLVLILLDVWPLGRVRRAQDLRAVILEKWPLLALSLAAAAMVYLAQAAYETVQRVPMEVRFANALFSYGRYIWMHISFARLGVLYPPETIRAEWLAGVVALLAALTALAFWRWRAWPWLLVGWLWYLGTLVPLAGFVQSGEQAYADRYTYFSSIGLLVMLAYSLPAAAFTNRGRWITAGAATAVLAVLVGFANRQAFYWHDSFTLFGRTLAVTRDNPLMQHTLAVTYTRAAALEPARAPEYLQEAYRHEVEMVRLLPGSGQAHGNLAVACAMRGDFAQALQEAATAVQLAPDDPKLRDVYGALLANAGQLELAVAQFREAVRLAPGYAAAQAHLAQAQGDLARSGGGHK